MFKVNLNLKKAELGYSKRTFGRNLSKSNLFKNGRITVKDKVRIHTDDAKLLLKFAIDSLDRTARTEVSHKIATEAAKEQRALIDEFRKRLQENAKLEITNERKNEYAFKIHETILKKLSTLEGIIYYGNKELPGNLKVSSNFEPHKVTGLRDWLTPSDNGAYYFSVRQATAPNIPPPEDH